MTTKKNNVTGYVVVRGHHPGVFLGKLVERDGDIVTLDDCHRIHYWSGAASCSELAINGIANPDDCRIPVPTDGHMLKGWCEIIPATARAVQSIKAAPRWTMH